MFRSNIVSTPIPRAHVSRVAFRVSCAAMLLAAPLAAAQSSDAVHTVTTATPSAAPTFTVRVVGRGVPVILIPGLMSGADVWDGTVAHLSARFQLHVVQVAGFAGTAASAGDDFPGRLRDSLLAYARTLHGPNTERPVVVGHSFGAFLAYGLAAAAPDAFGGIVAVDGVPFLPALQDPASTADAMRPGAAGLGAMFASLSGDQLAAQSRAGLPRLMRDTSHMQQATEWARTSTASTVGQVMAAMMTTDLRSVVGAIRSPVLQMAAGGSAPSSVAIAQLRAAYEAQVANVAHHDVVVAEHAYHFIMLDDPAFFYATLDAFLARVASVRAPGRAR